MDANQTWRAVLNEFLDDPDFRKEWEATNREWIEFDTILAVRREKGLVVETVADRMGVGAEEVEALEADLARGILPSGRLLMRYAEALGKHVSIRFV